jgi:hypothetical protein
VAIVSTVESAFWTLLFLVLGTGLIAARNGAEGAWPIIAGVVSYIAAAYFLWQLLISDR